MSPWWNAFLAPHEVGNFRESRVSEIQQSISFRDKPVGIPGATDPTPEDVVATVAEYQIGPGDVLSIRLLDFVQIGLETDLTLQVDELGYIHVPQIGWLRVDGMTTRQIQADVAQQAKNAGIYSEQSEPTITVQILSRQHRTYNISGAIAAPGEYPIPRPDFRLREAINQAGSLPDAVKGIYVFRNEPRQKRVKPVVGLPAMPAGAGQPPAAAPGQPLPPAPPVTPDALSEMATSPGPPADKPVSAPAGAATRSVSAPATQTRPTAPAGLRLPTTEVERDLLEAVGAATTPARSRTAPGDAPTPTMPTYIFVNNEFVEAPPATGTGAMPPAAAVAVPPAGPRPMAETPTSGPVNWEELAEEGQQRVIRIPADRIRHGDANYNLVVRHQDWIELDPGQVGVFYVGGHVIREGVYALSGEDITLTQAIVSAGGLDQIAWPTRCEIRRRLDGNREEITQWDLARIMAGQDPDLFIKKNDVIRVGTHAIAPLLATIRNSLRLTYGFGFVYDRNFADIDAYMAKSNPEDVRRYQRQQRGLLTD